MNVLYSAIFKYSKQDKRYLITFPDFPEAITEAATLKEAYINASDVLTLTLEGRMEEDMEIPSPSHHKKAILVPPSARIQSALLLKWNKGNHTNAEIARALGTSWPAVARLEDPHHWPSLRQLERTAAALGQRLVISMEPLVHK